MVCLEYGRQVSNFTKSYLMKKYSVCLIITFINMLLLNTLSFSQSQSEGLLKYSTYDISINNLTKEEFIEHLEWTNIWFKDSCVIYELRINLETNNQTKDGYVVKKSYPIWRYIYLDLKTMICQDYFNFKDTAMPLFNYSLKSNDTLSIWRFFSPSARSDTLPGVFTMQDTVLKNKIFKRVKVLYKYYPQLNYYVVYYFDCNAKKNIFHLNRTLSGMYPNCKANRMDFFDSTGNVMIRTEYEIIKTKLNNEEERIFKQWNKNARKTKLPLLSFSEVKKVPLPYHEHENPKITILPLEKEKLR